MPRTVLHLPCRQPDLVKKGLEADAQRERGAKVAITAEREGVKIEISCEKPNRLKAIANTYTKLVEMLEKIERIE